MSVLGTEASQAVADGLRALVERGGGRHRETDRGEARLD